MENVWGLVVSGAYVLVVLSASSLLARVGLSSEGSRKLVHIALGGWWLVASWFFTSLWWAAVLPAAFVAVNAWAYRSRKLSFMARDAGEDTPGTVYYAVSLALLALFSFGVGMPYVGALGVLCMSFGDGFAAVLGKRFGKRVLGTSGGRKSLVGSVTMFAASFASCAAVLAVPAPIGAGLAGGGLLPGAGGAALGVMADVGPVAGILLVAAVLAAAATLLELFACEGLDNLSVPLGVTALYAVLFLPSAPYTPVLAGLVLSGAIVLASLRMRLLTLPGGLGALIVGTLAFAWGGWPLWLLLMWFFGSSNAASKVMARRRGRPRTPGGPRKLRQVLANGVPFLVCAAVWAATGEPWFLVVSAGALAACTADTWASEIGSYSSKPPVNIVTREPMQRGLSGGVSPLGLAATVASAAATGVLAVVLFWAFGIAVPAGPLAFLFIAACGVAGSLVDSMLGVLVQAKYRPPGGDSQELVEASPGRGASGYTLVSGYAWVTNDAVNFMSGIAVVALGVLVAG